MIKNNKQLIIIILVAIVAIVGVLFYFWDKSNITVLDAKKYGLNCRVERICGDLVGIDCGAAYDGPYFYVKKETGMIVSRCGGYCMTGKCKNCPPKEWKCDTY